MQWWIDTSRVIAVNKWDSPKTRPQRKNTKVPDSQSSFLSYTGVVHDGAEGKNVTRCISLVQSMAKQANKRVSTGVLNRAVDEIRNGPRPKSSMAGAKIYATQVAVMPPTIALFVNQLPCTPIEAHDRKQIPGSSRVPEVLSNSLQGEGKKDE